MEISGLGGGPETRLAQSIFWSILTVQRGTGSAQKRLSDFQTLTANKNRRHVTGAQWQDLFVMTRHLNHEHGEYCDGGGCSRT